MVCEAYNLIKEGDLRNSDESGIRLLSTEEIFSLYDGNISSGGVTLSGSGQVKMSLQASFGEAYDVCHVDYYTDEIDVSTLLVSYGTISGTDNSVSFSLFSPGIYRAEINDFVRFIDLSHTISGTVSNIYEIEVVGVKNEEVGFGLSKENAQDFIYLEHSSGEKISSSPNEVFVFNNEHYEKTVKVAAAPTLSGVDNYVFISTSENGTYYGINDFGFVQPGPNPISLEDDSFLSTTINPQWERRGSGQQHIITPTKEGLIFDFAYDFDVGQTASQQTMGIESTEFFTATSFTAEFEIKFLALREPSVTFTLFRRFFMVLTNSYPIKDVGFIDAFMSDYRRGGSVGGITFKPQGVNEEASTETFTYAFRYVDGNSDTNPLIDNTEDRFSNGIPLGTPEGTLGEIDSILGPTADGLSDVENQGVSLGDFTSNAVWHNWRLVYDHQEEKLSGYVDNVFLGSRVFSVESFNEACKLFIGFHGSGGVRWQIRNFKIFKDKVYRQTNVALSSNGGQASATISGSEASKATDNNTSTAYVGPAPDSNSHVRVDFDGSHDIVNYRIKQRNQGTGTSAYGKTYFPDVARTSIVDFGGKKTNVIHSYPNTDEYVFRSPTFSGTAVVASGIQYLDINFISYDRTSQPNGALVIEELEVWAEEFVDVEVTSSGTELQSPWVAGRWNNLTQSGTSDYLLLKDTISPEAGFRPFPEYFRESIDYGFSSAVCGRQFSDTEDFHHTETLFSSPEPTETGNYAQWHSDIQADRLFYIWRVFDENSKVRAIYWDSGTLRPSNIADKFKFQYLKDGADPNQESSWIDIPPINQTHTLTGSPSDSDYTDYRDYLIANNDGEFYTDYFLLPDGINFSIGSDAGGLSSPTGLIVPDGYFVGSSGDVFQPRTVTTGDSSDSTNGLKGYVEFDETVITRGIRMVIKDPIQSGAGTISSSDSTSSTAGNSATNFALESLDIYRENGSGSYLSPVFDTGSPQNTERIYTSLGLPMNTSASVFVRSHDSPPEKSLSFYEFWEDIGTPGNNQVSFPITVSDIGATDRAITNPNNSDETIFILVSSPPKVYNHVLDTWANFDGLPQEEDLTEDVDNNNLLQASQTVPSNFSSTRPAIVPDDRVINNVVVLGGNIYVAAHTDVAPPLSSVIKYDFSDSRWSDLKTERPDFAEDSLMAGFEDKLYFFDTEGTISYFDVNTILWTVVDAEMPTYGSSRDRMAGGIVDGKVYIFGGRVNSAGINNLDIFDVQQETIVSGSSAPYPMIGHQAIFVPEERVFYLLPLQEAADPHHAAMKYFIDEDRWEVSVSMMWSRAVRGPLLNTRTFYYYHSGYIYAMVRDRGHSRAPVISSPWSSGKSVDFRDKVWGDVSNTAFLSWKEVGEGSELLPQKRYVQYKVELYSNDRVSNPVLQKAVLVQPQDVVVPASGTSSIYLKVDVMGQEVPKSLISLAKIKVSD